MKQSVRFTQRERDYIGCLMDDNPRWTRVLQVDEWRAAGWTYAAIAKKLGVSIGRAQQIHCQTWSLARYAKLRSLNPYWALDPIRNAFEL